MPKTVSYTLAGIDYQMPASYKVAREIGQRVGDPLAMAIKAEKGEIPWTLESTIDIIPIGVKAAGCSLSRDDVADAVFDEGVTGALQASAELIGQIVAGGPANPIKADGGKKS
jgi:hypothetical protein